MKTLYLSMVLAIVPAAAMAEKLVCQSNLYCDEVGNCQPFSSRLVVEYGADNRATMQWDDAPTVPLTVLQASPTLILADGSSNGSGTMLIVGEALEARYFSVTDFGSYMIAGVLQSYLHGGVMMTLSNRATS